MTGDADGLMPLPCPFCGAVPVLDAHDSVYCDCGAQMVSGVADATLTCAVRRWNRRPECPADFIGEFQRPAREAALNDLAASIAERPQADAEAVGLLRDLFAADLEFCMRGDGHEDQLEVLERAKAYLARITGAKP
jgi:hypothetical protein